MTTGNAEHQYETLTIMRKFNAPIETVWKAWTDPKQFAAWWSPDGFTISTCELEVRPDGKFHVEMKGPDGTIYPTIGQFKEVIDMQRLSFINAPLDDEGNKLFEVLQTVIFSSKGDSTELKVTSEVLNATPEAVPYLAGMEPGLTQALEKLDSLIKRSEISKS
jgi:uncharacterized protein YndB with AHSA1/START domain